MRLLAKASQGNFLFHATPRFANQLHAKDFHLRHWRTVARRLGHPSRQVAEMADRLHQSISHVAV